MKRKMSSWRIAVVLLVLLLPSGCATPRGGAQRQAAATPADVGPRIRLIEAGGTARVRGAMDREQRVHLLVEDVRSGWITPSSRLHYMRIDPDGTVLRELMRDTGSVSGPLDIAVDDAGRLHAIADGKYIVRTDGTWLPAGGEPWGGAEISDAKLAASGRGVVCAFVVGGKAVSAPGRWDVHAVVIGGYGGAAPLIFPWRSYPSKLVVTRREESSWSNWTILDPDDNTGVENFEIASDAAGTVHALYSRLGRKVFVQPRGLYYARFSTGTSEGGGADGQSIGAGPKRDGINKVTGIEICAHTAGRVEQVPARPAVDAPTGAAVVYTGEAACAPAVSERAKPGFPNFFGSSTGIQPSHTAPAGRRRFHAIFAKVEESLLTARFSVQYLVLADRAQSGQTEIDEGKPMGLVSNGSARTLAVTFNNGVLFARWIEARDGSE